MNLFESCNRMLCLALISTFAFSCGKVVEEKIVEVEKEKTIVENTWGLEFKTTPAAQAPEALKSMTPAVSFIQTPFSTATGFFVSSDGLFLTNHHVIGKNMCSKEKCLGIKFIRDFHTDGDAELFDDFEILAQNEDLDYTLIKINLKNNQKVPFLHLAKKVNNDLLKQSELKVVGHPFGGGLRVSDAIYSSLYNSEIKMMSVAISGNSGSPLIDTTSKEVLGLYHSSWWNKGSIGVNGGVKHFSYATTVEEILNNLSFYFNVEQNQDGLVLTENKGVPANQVTLDLIPQSYIPKSDINIENWLYQSYQTSDEEDFYNLALKKSISKYYETTHKDKGDISSLIYQRFVLDSQRPQPLPISAENWEELKNIYSDHESNFYMNITPLKILHGELSQEKCLEKFHELDKNSHEIYLFNNLSYYCLSKEAQDKKDILTEIIYWGKNVNDKNDQKVINIISETLTFQLYLHRGKLEQETKNEIKKVFFNLSQKSKNWSGAMKNEQLALLVQHGYFD